MLNIKFIREHADKIRDVVRKRNFDPKKADVDKLLQLDDEKNNLQNKIDILRTRRNQIAGSMKQDHSNQELINEGRKVKLKIADLENKLAAITHEWQEVMDWIPNLPLDDVPEGKGEADNLEIKAWSPKLKYLAKEKLYGAQGSSQEMTRFGTNGDYEFTPKPHWEIGKELDIIDLEAGAKVSGSRFYYLKKDGVLIMYAIFDLLMKKLLAEGFIPMSVPLLVRNKALYGSSHFPGDADQIYKIDSENVEDNNQLYLVGSTEPPLFAYYLDQVLNLKNLPVKIMALSPCFRSEAGSWGKDVRGMKRAHQFDKLEMDMIIEADLGKAYETHEYLLSLNEWLLQGLELPYHVINMCMGDLGYAAAAKKYDIEVWLPSTGEFMETMSNTIATDFQARRLNIRYKDKNGKLQFVYTLNNTGATHRLLIAILDHYQQSDGSVKVPEVLKGYLGKDKISKA